MTGVNRKTPTPLAMGQHFDHIKGKTLQTSWMKEQSPGLELEHGFIALKQVYLSVQEYLYFRLI
jgi:hypothetical protein